jgi:hypothetical protein
MIGNGSNFSREANRVQTDEIRVEIPIENNAKKLLSQRSNTSMSDCSTGTETST